MTKDKRKLKAQVKSRWYYIFWGAATISVFAGQMHVGNGFNRMADSLDNVMDSPIIIDIGPPSYNDPMIIR
tara:strand:+ start:754 stop:966 length:213 start_codon:yes stop_codon:yes gene_type:complete